MASKAVAVVQGGKVTTIREKIRHRRGSRTMTIPLGIVAGFAPTIYYTLKQLKNAGFESAASVLVYNMTGYSMPYKTWNAAGLIEGWTPIALGYAVHKLFGEALGINRMLRRARIPLIRL